MMLREDPQDEGSRPFEAVAALLPGASMPRFKLRPEGFFDSVAGLVGVRDIDLGHDPEFSILYHLSGEDGRSVSELFSPTLTRSLRAAPGWYVAGHGEWVTLSKRRHLGASRLAAFVLEAKRISDAFDASSSGPPTEPTKL